MPPFLTQKKCFYCLIGLCFCYIERKFAYFLNPEFQASSHLSSCAAQFMPDLVGNPEDKFSHEAVRVVRALEALSRWVF